MVEILKKITEIDVKSIELELLESILPTLGMNGENDRELPKELSQHFNKGIRFWQYPNQFAPYLKQLSKYEIKSYLEIGCRWGGTFIITNEILNKVNGDILSYACDIIPPSKVLNEYKNYSNFTYLNKDSKLLSRDIINHDIDLIMIDGDHSYTGLSRDFDVSKQFNPKYITFHDIYSDVCPDVVKFWSEIKDQYKHYEFIDQYDSVNGKFLGIGLIELQNV
jgi:hypothetical protein